MNDIKGKNAMIQKIKSHAEKRNYFSQNGKLICRIGRQYFSTRLLNCGDNVDNDILQCLKILKEAKESLKVLSNCARAIEMWCTVEEWDD